MQGGTILILWAVKSLVGAETFGDLITWLMEWAEEGSLVRLCLTAVAAVVLQLLPIFNSILLSASSPLLPFSPPPPSTLPLPLSSHHPASCTPQVILSPASRFTFCASAPHPKPEVGPKEE